MTFMGCSKFKAFYNYDNKVATNFSQGRSLKDRLKKWYYNATKTKEWLKFKVNDMEKENNYIRKLHCLE